MEMQEVEKLVTELRNNLIDSPGMKTAFEGRYRPDLDKVLSATNPGVINLRRFIMGKKIADYVEVQVKGESQVVLVYIGKEKRIYNFKSVLEAEVAIVDYLTGG